MIVGSIFGVSVNLTNFESVCFITSFDMTSEFIYLLFFIKSYVSRAHIYNISNT